MSAPDAIYTDQRLAALYDSLNPAGPDTDFYSSLPGRPSRILDLGCGTGLLTARLAEEGHSVIGIDPAAAMLDIARRRLGGDKVRWIEGDIFALEPGNRFDFIFMTGHVFQVFLTEAAVSRVLACTRRHLAVGGRLVFESRNPALRPWKNWTPEISVKTIDHPDLGRVRIWHELVEMRGGQARFRTHSLIEGQGEPFVSESRLAFRERGEIEHLLRAAGFSDMTWLGDWHGGPLEAGSAEIIVKAG